VNPFDADTALAQAGELRWRGTVSERWSNGQGPGINGGLFAAMTTRAALEATGLPARSLTIHYLAAPEPGDVELVATIPRAGRSTAFARLDIVQGDHLMGQAIAVCTAWRDDAPAFSDAEPPPVAPRERCRRVEAGGLAPPLVTNYELLFDADFEGVRRPAWIGGWIRTARPRPSDQVALAAMTDAFMPPAFFRPGEPVVVPTLELTIHFRAQPPAGEHPWICGWFSSPAAGGGVVGEDGELWSEDGTLLVQSRQLAMMRRRAA
jgi:acyl-coenzyme A thioesterase PaaI-like protein